MRAFSSLPAAALGLFLAACGGNGPATLLVTGSEFTALEGKPVKVAVVDAAANRIAVTATPSPVTGGAFQFSFPVTSGRSYRVDLYVETDGDEECQWGFDDVHAIDVSPLRERETRSVSIKPGVTDSRGCLSFGASSLHVTASNIQTDKTFWNAALVRCALEDRFCTSVETAGLRSGKLSNGRIDFVFDGAIVPRYFYRVNVFVNDPVGLEVPCDSAPVKLSNETSALPGPLTDGLTGETVDLLLEPAAFDICPSFTQP